MKDGEDINSLMRDMMSALIEGTLDGELDDTLGYDRYDYENKDYEVMRRQFEALGFKNIKTVPLGDLNIFTGFRSGKVEEIRINNEFMKDDVYYEDDPVVIKYHSK